MMAAPSGMAGLFVHPHAPFRIIEQGYSVNAQNLLSHLHGNLRQPRLPVVNPSELVAFEA